MRLATACCGLATTIGSVAIAQVDVIDNPPGETQSAFVFPVGEFEPIVGYRNWDVLIIHDPTSIPNLSQSKSYNIWTNRVGIDSVNVVYIISKVNPTSGTTTVSIGLPPSNNFINVGSVVMSDVAAERTGLVTVDPVVVDGDFLGLLYAHRFNLAGANNMFGDVFLESHASRQGILQISVRGDITGDIVTLASQNGILSYVDRIITSGGKFGASSLSNALLVEGYINIVRAGEINAYIGGVESSGIASFAQTIARIETYSTGGHSGVFAGQIDAQQIVDFDTQANWIKLEGPMQGLVRLGYGFVDNSSNPSFKNYIQVPAGGMQGQVIMRALGGPESFGVWNQPFYVGSQVVADDLNPKPHYLETSDEIGGGAAGRVPYGTHFTSGFPAFTSDPSFFPTVSYGAIDDKNPIRVRLYGPVILPAFPARAFKIERRLADSTASWTDETCGFAESLDSTGNEVLLEPIRALPAGFEYRVSQVLTTGGQPFLACDGVELPTTPPPVDLFDLIPVTSDRREFRFTVCGPSPGDADSNGCVNFADNTSVLENWQSTACIKNGDANRDGAVDFMDITAVLQYWLFAYCEGTCSSSMTFGVAESDSFVSVQGECVAQASSDTVLQALTSLGYPSIEAFGLAIAHMTDEERTFEMERLESLLGDTN